MKVNNILSRLPSNYLKDLNQGEWNVIIAKDIPHFGYNVKYDKGCIIQATHGGYTFLIFKSPIVL